jgi:1-deoxy-D-xylulose-5-phosphate synthase
VSRLIDSLSLPSDLRSLSLAQLKVVVDEIRDELIDSVASSGGHFASSLGATEITVVLHHLFNTPLDKIIWDVGHQAYVHKMVTGRRSGMSSIRTKGGLSGFLKRAESEYDAFGAGHAGTSISAAVGMRMALDRSDKKDTFVVSVIGDGSLTSGMAFEALNHAGDLGLNRFIVVLNDNEMSISENVGALRSLFSRAITSHFSTRARSTVKSLHEKGYLPNMVYRALDRAEEAAQSFFAEPAMLFESFGFRYIGPIDGHNIESLTTALEHAKLQQGPVLVHASTLKGKGYCFAEEDPLKWHAVTPFERSEGKVISSSKTTPLPPTYTTVFADALIELAKNDERIIGITAAMPSGTGLDKVKTALPRAFCDVGICEQHAVTFSAGLACEGLKPICAIYSTFLQRGYDQIIHDVCIQNLPVVFALDRAGVVGNDGETHQGVFDIAFLRAIPNLVLMSPKDEGELRHMLYSALEYHCPVAIRYPRGTGVGAPLDEPLTLLPLGKGEVLSRGKDLLLFCYGPVTTYGLHIAQQLESQFSLSTTLINMRFAKPLDKDLIASLVPHHTCIATIEDHALMSGFGSSIIEKINDLGLTIPPILRFGVHDEFVPHGSQQQQQELHGYTPQQIIDVLSVHPLLMKLNGGPITPHEVGMLS